MTAELKFSIIDSHKGDSSKTFHHISTAAAADTDAVALVASFAKVSGMGVTRTAATDTVKNASATHTCVIDAGSNKDEGVTVQVMQDNAEIASIKIPAPQRDGGGLHTYVTNGVVDVTNADLLEYLTHFGKTGFNGRLDDSVFTLANGRRITAVISGTLD